MVSSTRSSSSTSSFPPRRKYDQAPHTQTKRDNGHSFVLRLFLRAEAKLRALVYLHDIAACDARTLQMEGGIILTGDNSARTIGSLHHGLTFKIARNERTLRLPYWNPAIFPCAPLFLWHVFG